MNLHETFRALNANTKVTDGIAKVAGAVKDEFGIYKISCNAKVPSLFLTFGATTVEIPGSELVKPLSASDPNCILNVFGDDTFPGFFLVGASLARKYCLAFDYDGLQMGFAANHYAK